MIHSQVAFDQVFFHSCNTLIRVVITQQYFISLVVKFLIIFIESTHLVLSSCEVNILQWVYLTKCLSHIMSLGKRKCVIGFFV